MCVRGSSENAWPEMKKWKHTMDVTLTMMARRTGGCVMMKRTADGWLGRWAISRSTEEGDEEG